MTVSVDHIPVVTSPPTYEEANLPTLKPNFLIIRIQEIWKRIQTFFISAFSHAHKTIKGLF